MVVAGKRSRHLVQGQSNRELRLRVVGSQRDGQVIRLTSPKCTIGSARGCTLRLRAAGVRPIHCLILRGAQATVARTCPAGARLNGQEFLDAPLVAGDQLQVGPVTLEVIEQFDGDERVDRDDASAAVVSDTDKAERIRVAHRRARKLVEAVRTVRAEMALLRQQSEVVHTASAAELDADRQRMTDERQQREEWESSLTQDRDELDRRKSELDEFQLELEAQAEQLRDDRESWEQAQQAAAAQRDLDQQSLAAERQSLASLQESLDRDRAAFEQQQRDYNDQIEQRGGELERSQQELAELRQQLEAQRHEWESQQSELEQAHASGHDEIEQLRTMLANDRQAWSELQQEQEARLKTEVAQMQIEHDELCRRQQELQAAQSDLEQRSQDLTSREEQSHALESEFKQRQTELDALAAELAVEQSSLAETESQHEQHRSELQQAQTGLEQARGELERAHHALDRARAEVEHDRGQLHERQARLTEERTEFEAEQLVLAESRAELARSQAEIAAGFEQLLEGHEALESARRQFAERDQALSAREESVDDRLNEVHTHRATWAIELSAWESIQAAAAQSTETSEYEAHGAAVADLQTQLSEARERFANHQQQLDESLSQCAALSAELDQLRSQFEQQQAAFALERAHWDEQRQTWASREADDFSRSDAETTLGVQAEEPFDEEATVKMEAPPVVEAADAFASEPLHDEYADADEQCEDVRASGASCEADEDKSIEQCFEELLNRYRQQGTEGAPAAPAKRGKRKPEAKPTKAPNPAAASSSPVNLQETMEIRVVDLLTPPAEIQRRSSAEIPNFDAMREVAVSHANLAIDTHGRKRVLRAALVTSSAALGATFVTLILLGGLAYHYTELRTLASVGWVLAIFWAFVASKAWRQVAAARKADEQGLRENRERVTRKSSG